MTRGYKLHFVLICFLGYCTRGNERIPAVKHTVSTKRLRQIQDVLSSRNDGDVLSISREDINMEDMLSSRDKFLLSILRGDKNICANGKTRCNYYESCCEKNGGYGCCPFLGAVCCGNGRCCQSGHVCSKDGLY